MMTKINYKNANSKIRSLFKNEELFISEPLMKTLLTFLSIIHIYEEEDHKISPEIIIGKNLLNDDFKKIYQCEILQITRFNTNDDAIQRIIKPIMPFCDNGWRVLVNIEDENVTVGLIRAFGGPSALSLIDSLLTPIDLTQVSFRFVLVDIMSKYEVLLSGLSGMTLQIDFRFIVAEIKGRKESVERIVDDLLSDCDYMDYRENQKNAMSKVFELCPKRVHGCIFVIINKESILPISGLLKDGIILEEPINLISPLVDALRSPEIHSLYEKYYAQTGLLLTMLNTDGITVLDTASRIRGYNFFIQSTQDTVAGGARRRAANSLMRSKNENIVGVYFQSQDGDIFYERVNTIE